MRNGVALSLLGLLALAIVANAALDHPEAHDAEVVEEDEEHDHEKHHPMAIHAEEDAHDEMPHHEGSFIRADEDANGSLSKEEYKAFFRTPLEKMKTVSKQAVEASDKIRGDIFDRLDGDHDGQLTRDEWHGGHKNRGVRSRREHHGPGADMEASLRSRSPFRGTPEDKAKAFLEADVDQSKTLSPEEFTNYMVDAVHPRHKREDKANLNGEARSFSHARAQMRSVEQEARLKDHEDRHHLKQVERYTGVFKNFDADNDGALTQDEFVNGMAPGARGKAQRKGDTPSDRHKYIEEARARAEESRRHRQELLGRGREAKESLEAGRGQASDAAAANSEAAIPAKAPEVPTAEVKVEPAAAVVPEVAAAPVPAAAVVPEVAAAPVPEAAAAPKTEEAPKEAAK